MSAKVAIVSAMERELAPLLKDWSRSTVRHGSRVYGVRRSGAATYIACGIGRRPAELAARALVESERPDIVISAGFAGALTREWSVGDTITPGTVIDAETGERFSTCGGTGVLVSAATIANEHAKTNLAEQFGAEAVEMEASAVALVAKENGVPFCAVKAISDEVGFTMPPFQAYITPEGRLAVERFAAHVAVHPGYWPSLVQLAVNSRKASLELSSALQHLLSTISGKEDKDFKQALGELSARPVV